METPDLLNCTDARKWAEEFVRTRETVTKAETVESMECWFATAILAGQILAGRKGALGEAALAGAKDGLGKSDPVAASVDPNQPRDEDGKWSGSGEHIESIAKQAFDSGDHEEVGFRYIPDGEWEPSQELKKSRVWVPDESGDWNVTDDEQEGVSAFKKLSDMKRYTKTSTGHIVVVGGGKGRMKGDILPGETMITEPKVLGHLYRKSSGARWEIQKS